MEIVGAGFLAAIVTSLLVLPSVLWSPRRSRPDRRTEEDAPRRARPGGSGSSAPSGRALILTAAIGGGHEAAGRTVYKELRAAGYEARVEDGLHLMTPSLSRALARSYREQGRRTSRSLGAIFAFTSWRMGAAGVRLLSGVLLAHRLRGLLDREKPDVVVSTYPLVTAALGRLRRRGELAAPVLAVVADYGVHAMWVVPDADLHLVVSLRSAELTVRAGGLACPVRMPIDLAFGEAPTREEARQRLGIPADEFVALVVGGVWGLGDIEGATRRAVAAGVLTLVVTGENEELRGRLATMFAGDENAWVLGWRDDMPTLMAASDCLIQNAGGMTCIEAVASGLPILMFNPIPGHGEFNAQIMREEGAALLVETPEDLERLLHSARAGDLILQPPQQCEEARELTSILKSTLRYSSRRIAKTLHRTPPAA